jgi:hypothetical protein
MGILLLASALCVLSEEVDSFLDEYRFNGYAFQWSRGLYLALEEPCTLWVSILPGFEGVISAAGGEDIFDLGLELRGGDMIIVDEEPDDMPVLRFVTGPEPEVYRAVITIREMLYMSTADSAYVFFALKPVIENIDTLVPAGPDSAITGE